MSREKAMEFFKACEEGKGWQGCKEFCSDNASFSAQAEPLKDITTLEGYADWMSDIYTPMPNASYEIKSMTLFVMRFKMSSMIMLTHRKKLKRLVLGLLERKMRRN